MHNSESFVAAFGRLLMSAIFIQAGINKFGTIDATAAQMASHGIPLSNLLVYGALALELGGGLMLLTGFCARWAALALAAYTLALALVFHPYWTFQPPEFRVQRGAFWEHIAMIGGLLMVTGLGPGRLSLDALMHSTKWSAVAA
jgi:putative oxidoreductase